LAAQYPDFASFNPNIGTTEEGRTLFGFHFTSKKGTNKPSIYFQCQIHAREWISGATCGYIINSLLSQYGKQDNITFLLDNVQFYVNPIQNPDGYVYTWSGDRLWRKNRGINSGSSCKGTDLNRNYNDHWGEGGSSSNPCSETYKGGSVNSEPETKASIEYFRSAAPVIGAIDWHSYSQLILRPYGWTRQNAPDEPQLKQLGDGISTAIRAVHGLHYISEKSIDLYVTTGTASDWFYGEDATNTNKGYRAAGYTIELRDTGRYGFVLPPSQIIPCGEENLEAVIYFVTELIKNPIHVKYTNSTSN
jgi:murein tripeptide amidase MpaA